LSALPIVPEDLQAGKPHGLLLPAMSSRLMTALVECVRWCDNAKGYLVLAS
jgi:hypothetical protein